MKRRGTTLLELTVATMLILLVVSFMVSLWVNQLKMMGRSRDRMTASSVAELKLEEWTAKGWVQASQDALQPSLSDGELVIRTQMGSATEITLPYKYHVETLEDPDPAKTALVGILRVTVRFPGAENSTYKEVRYQTYLPKQT